MRRERASSARTSARRRARWSPRPTKRRARPRETAAGGPDARRIARGARTFRGLRPEGDRDPTRFRRRRARARRVMLVGEAPGADEDRIGRPFVGRAGQVARPHARLDRARSDEGLYRQRRAVAAAGKSHADAAGDDGLSAVHDAPDRARRTRGWLVCLGASATQTLLGTRKGSPAPAASGANMSARTGARSRRCRCFIPPICCASRPPSARPGPTCANSPARWRKWAGQGRGVSSTSSRRLRWPLDRNNCYFL